MNKMLYKGRRELYKKKKVIFFFSGGRDDRKETKEEVYCGNRGLNESEKALHCSYTRRQPAARAVKGGN